MQWTFTIYSPPVSRRTDNYVDTHRGIEGNGQRIRSVNWANWTDLEARDAMLTAINREARQLIHGEDIASTGFWMNKTWGRLAVQLRRFPMMAMHKQLARAIADRDLHAVMDFALTGTVGAASMWAQAHLMTEGMNAEDRQKYLEENATPGRLFAAFIQRNPYSGMLPQMVDALSSTVTGHPVFDTRATGLSGGIGGIPALDAGSKLASTAANLLHGKPLTQRGVRALVEAAPLGNSLPAVWLANALSENLPKEAAKEPGAHKGAWLK